MNWRTSPLHRSTHNQRWAAGLALALLTACSFTRFKPVERAMALDEAFHLLTSLVRPTKEEVPLDDRTAHCYQLPLNFAVSRAATDAEVSSGSTRSLPVRQEVGSADKTNTKVMGSVLLPKETDNACSQAVERVSQWPRALQRLPKIADALAQLTAQEDALRAVIQTLEVSRLQLEVEHLQAAQHQTTLPQATPPHADSNPPSGVDAEGAPITAPSTTTASTTTAPITAPPITAPPADATSSAGSTAGAPTATTTGSAAEPPATAIATPEADLELNRVRAELEQLRVQSDTMKAMRVQLERMRELEVTRTRGELTYDPASNTADGVLVIVTNEELDAGEQVWLDLAHGNPGDAVTRFDLRVTNDIDWFGLPVGASLVVVFLVLTAA